ncbi:MAG: Hsp70 family protein, partial [Actinobacteria bacterium]|nr:Hsp70 family protein [Actinomycetota bacterium]
MAIPSPEPEEGIVVAPCRLGADRIDIPAAAYVTDDGDVLFGEAAEKQGSEHPERLLHDFVRDVGDSTPLIAGDFAVRADDLYARLMGWAVMTVTAARGAPPALVAIAHPDSWRGHRIEAVRTRLSEMGLDAVLLLPAAAAAARQQYAAGGLPARGTVAVYDFGGSGFCGAVLRAQGGGDYRLTDTPVLLDDVSGRAFDHRVLHHALAMAERRTTAAESPAGSRERRAVLSAVDLSAARHAATKAKEALSFGPETAIELDFDDRPRSVRLTRFEFESMIGGDLDRTADALDRALEVAG